MGIAPGDRLLDVGCGAGADTVSLAQLTGAEGRVDGVDTDAALLAAANRRAVEAGVSDRVRHWQEDAMNLPFADGEFDSSRSERLFQHLAEPGRALAEMVRVTRRGGRVVVLDTDWGTASVDSTETDIERRLMRFLAERLHPNGYSGRRLQRLFAIAGLENVSVEAFPLAVSGPALVRQVITADNLEREALGAGLMTDDELRRWRSSLENAGPACFFCATVMLAAGARRR
jgi:SAM-dependent methyltransferase